MNNTKADLSKNFMRSLSGATVLVPISLALTFLMNLVAARYLGVKGFGAFSYVLSAASLFAMVSTIGTHTSVMRLVPKYTAARDNRRLRGLLIFGTVACLTGGAICGALAVAGSLVWAPARLDLMIFAAAVTPLVSYGLWRKNAMRGLHKIFFAMLPKDIAVPLAVCIALIVIAAPHFHEAMWSYIVVVLAAEVGGTAILWRAVPYETPRSAAKFEVGRWFRMSLPMLLSTVLRGGLNRWDVVMMGWWTTLIATGTYAAAARLALLGALVMRVVNLVAGPMIATAYESGDIQYLRKLIVRLTLFSAILGLPIFGVLILFPESVIGVFGASYSQGANILRILSIGQLVNTLTGPVAFVLLMTGNEKLDAKIMTVVAVLNIIANYVLIHKFGATGAAIALSGTLVLMNLVIFLFVHIRIFNRAVIR